MMQIFPLFVAPSQIPSLVCLLLLLYHIYLLCPAFYPSWFFLVCNHNC